MCVFVLGICSLFAFFFSFSTFPYSSPAHYVLVSIILLDPVFSFSLTLMHKSGGLHGNCCSALGSRAQDYIPPLPDPPFKQDIPSLVSNIPPYKPYLVSYE